MYVDGDLTQKVDKKINAMQFRNYIISYRRVGYKIVTCSHLAYGTNDLIALYGSESLDHPPRIFDLVPTDYPHFFS